VGGEPGFTKHNQHFLSLIETPWEGPTQWHPCLS
jgi:hypothetical protein